MQQISTSFSDTARLLDLPDSEAAGQMVARWARENAIFAGLVARYCAPAKALRHFGLSAWGQGRLDQAHTALVASVALQPDEAPAWSDLAGVVNALGRPQEAEACVRRALALDSRQPTAWLTLAGLCNAAGDHAGAEQAFGAALDVDPGLAPAHFGLGLLRFGERRLDEAAGAFRAAVAHGADDAMTHASLGHVTYLLGHFGESVAAFNRAAAHQPLDPGSRQRHAHAALLVGAMIGDLDDAIADYRDALRGAADVDDALEKAFGVLSGFGHAAAAAVVGERLVADRPDDPVRRYLLDAVRGTKLDRAPDDYIEHYFNRFAPSFDKTLVEVLRYDVPAELAQMLAHEERRFSTILDVGCGTGLAAAHLRPLCDRLVGVDIAGAMLERAAGVGSYAALHKAEAVAFLEAQQEAVDAVVAADLLVYVGDLAPFFAATVRALRPDGLLAISIETRAGGGFAILPSGRFSHSPAYVEAVARPAFELVERRDRVIRLEANRPVDGALMLFRRRP